MKKTPKKQVVRPSQEVAPKKQRKAFVPAELKKHESLPVITAGSVNLW